MRPTANFTLHAILAACLAALAASSAAADDAIGAARFSLTIDGVEVAGEQKQHIDLLSYSFGNGAGVSGAEQERNIQMDEMIIRAKKPEPRYDRNAAPVGGVTVGAGDINNSGTAGRVTGLAADPADPSGLHEVKPPRDASLGSDSKRQAQAGHSMLGASDKVTVGGGRTESAASAGQYRTLRPRPNGTGPGTLTIRGNFPGCKVGQRYPQAMLSDGSVRFTIDSVTVTSCGEGATESVSFSYARLKYGNSPPSDGKVKVRGWDPEKKEQ